MSHLALLIPGGFQGADVRLPPMALRQCGAEVREIPLRASYPGTPDLDANRVFYGEMRDEIQQHISSAPWTEVTFIGKSIGTMILAAIGAELRDLPAKVNAIWLAPIFKLDYVRDGVRSLGWRSLVVSGAADHYFSREFTDEVVQALGAVHLLIQGADHGFEVPDDAVQTVRSYDSIVRAILQFVAS